MINENWGVKLEVKKLLIEKKLDENMDGGEEVRGKEKINKWMIGKGIK